MALEDLGSDFYCIEDLDASWTVVTGETQMAHALVRRIGTGRQMLFYDADYGMDSRRYLNRIYREQVTSQAVEVECLKDERVENIRAEVEYISAASATATDTPDSLNIDLRVQTAEGSFDLSVLVDDLTIELLEQA